MWKPKAASNEVQNFFGGMEGTRHFYQVVTCVGDLDVHSRPVEAGWERFISHYCTGIWNVYEQYANSRRDTPPTILLHLTHTHQRDKSDVFPTVIARVMGDCSAVTLLSTIIQRILLIPIQTKKAFYSEIQFTCFSFNNTINCALSGPSPPGKTMWKHEIKI